MKITLNAPDPEAYPQFTVESDSGNTYTVRQRPPELTDPDIEFVRMWECNCPAGRFGRDCKHLRAVLSIIPDDDIPNDDFRDGTVLQAG